MPTPRNSSPHAPRISRTARRGAALLVWGAGIALLFVLGLWNLESSRRDAENRLSAEAGRMAAQLATLLALPAWDLDEITARTIVMGAMEDERLYAIKVETRQGMLEGQRRNYLWEPVPWDDELSEDCVQGMNPLKVEGQTVGSVEVWLSPRLMGEEEAQLLARERWRFGLAAAIWTLALVLLLWLWGDLAALRRLIGRIGNPPGGADGPDAKAAPEPVVLGLAPRAPEEGGEEGSPEAAAAAAPPVDRDLGRRFQRKNPDTWRVTAGLFRQTFARAPQLMQRLYADGETAGLCHLGRMLEQAAPCLGAARLTEAARQMQAALNDPDCETRALPVEECARALEEVLAALEGARKGQGGQ
ncbi:MAG: hypothetical protein HDR50_00020 [Desulfovibrio sp.]|uniref:hypothetical protein n=1 Tax=Desulfovibrio sp. TaxID=885 RepID=UPI001A79891A|nr:hypothetical protein [Desulfovibrio sp.]MBD5416081.1 hypothetical protein [Desulfovibrio sp.]